MYNDAPSLSDLQRWMRWVLTDSRGVAGALENSHPRPVDLPERDRPIISRFTAPDPDCRSWVADMPPLSQEARLSVYAEGYFLRLHDSLRDDFPRTYRLLGEDIFRAVVLEYTDLYPSRSYTLGELGRNLARFISEHPIRNFSPVLLDLAHFEWLENETFWGRRQAPISGERLAQKLSSPAVERLRIELADTVCPATSAFELPQLWADFEERDLPAIAKQLTPGEHYFVLHRPVLQVILEESSGLEYRLLNKVKAGACLGELFEDAGDATPEEIQTIFSRWTRLGWITDLPESTPSA